MKRMGSALPLAGLLFLLTGSADVARAVPARSQGALQLSLITPDTGSITDRFSLDVSFRGSVVEAVELYLDGNLVAKRQINSAQSRGVITFTLDTLQLVSGSHDVQVKAFTPDGKSAITSAKVRIPAMDLSAPVRIAYPQNGFQVNGIVPIRVFLESDLQRQKPYVTFWVDKDMKVLRNYPPYEYNWDTTKVINGWHVLEAWTQSPDSISPMKARPVHVSVNNPTGETQKKNSIEDLRNNGVVLKPVNPVDPGTAVSTGKQGDPTIVQGIPARLSTGAIPRPPGSNNLSNNPDIYGRGYATAPSTLPTPSQTNRRVSALPSPKPMGGAVVEPRGRPGVTSRQRGVLPPMGDAAEIYPVNGPKGGGDTIVVQPGQTLRGISRQTGVPAREIVRLNNLRSGNRLLAGQSLIVPRGGAFDVAFDGTLIAFDVPPRVESGVRLAPFRQIFEHTGGRLYWFGGSAQAVRAVNSSREIEIRIGSRKALVNNQPLTMERKPVITSGRTIVPLTFIRDALAVKVSYDEKTGRLLIESK